MSDRPVTVAGETAAEPAGSVGAHDSFAQAFEVAGA